MRRGRDSPIGSANTRSGYGCVGLGKSLLLSSSFRKALTPCPSPGGVKDGDGRCGPYV